MLSERAADSSLRSSTGCVVERVEQNLGNEFVVTLEAFAYVKEIPGQKRFISSYYLTVPPQHIA